MIDIKKAKDIIKSLYIAKSALDVSYDKSGWNNEIKLLEEAINELEKLQERETPMKPLRYDYGGYQCPSCKGLYVQARESDGSEVNLDYCNDCGQRLDWSEIK
jgi:predicted SprT family Zn-dependent metalloprotease